jgi:uncharacterized RDD family membrane protein YckC
MQPSQPNDFSPRLRAFDKHTIETPEQMPLEFAIAGIGSRFLAMAIDTLIQTGAAVVIVGIVILLGVTGVLSGPLSGGGTWVLAGVLAAIFVLYFGYFAVFEIVWNGQTPGKRRVGLRVIKDSGRPLTAAETIGRNFMRILDQLPFLYGLGMLVAMLNRQNKRIGDFVAGSIVIRETPFAEMRPAWQTAPDQNQAAPGTLGTGRISIDTLTIIEAFLQRRYELTPDVRSRMASEILNRVRGELSLPAVMEESTETILESVARERRSSGRY